MLKPATAVICLCAATMAEARSPNLSGQQISDLVAGTTVEIETPVGTKLPILYARDGGLSGEARSLAWYLGAVSDSGRWWVTSDQLCHKWNRWFDSEPQCMRLSKEGRIIRWRNQDGTSGGATIAVPAKIDAAAVPPSGQLDRTRQIAPPKTLPAPASAPEEQSAEPATGAGQPSQQIAKEAVVQAPPSEAPPVRARAAPDNVPSPQNPAEPKRASQPMFKVANVRSDDVLNVRSGPSAEFDVVGELPPGGRGIAVTSACRSNWCPVQHRSTSGWVNSTYLAPEEPLLPVAPHNSLHDGPADAVAADALRDSPEALRSCLTAAARVLLERIEQKFGSVKVMSTCRQGVFIAGTGPPSQHASGNAVDFDAGSRKAAIIEWLIANHRGGTMTYAGMEHIHVDIGPHFVSIASGSPWQSWRNSTGDFPGPQAESERR
jgi:hypothetical protein